MPVDSAVVGVEVVSVPLKRSITGTLCVSCAVIHLDRQDVVFIPKVNGAGDVQTVGRHPVLVKPDCLAVQENVAGLPHALEFEEDLTAGKSGRKLEMFAVPNQPFEGAQVPAAMRNDLTKGIDVVEAVR